jgi:hypothetical protein
MALEKDTDLSNTLNTFSLIDDFDVLTSIKNWMQHEDFILSELCKRLINRKLLKIQFANQSEIETLKQNYEAKLLSKMDKESISYFVFNGIVKNTLYKTKDEKINILFKNGEVKDISQVDNALVHQHLATQEEKHYICYLN